MSQLTWSAPAAAGDTSCLRSAVTPRTSTGHPARVKHATAASVQRGAGALLADSRPAGSRLGSPL